jgi:hypothetical protein
MRPLGSALLAVALVALGPAAFEAHAQGRNGSIVGRVTDAEGRRVSGARVTLHLRSCAPCLRGDGGQDTETNRDGEYAFVNAPPGVYEVRVTARAGTTLLYWRRRDVSVVLDGIARVDAMLEPLRVQIILRTYRPDGRIEATAETTSPTPNGFVWADPILCAPMASGVPRRSGPTPSVGWSVTGRALGASGETLAVRVQWQRAWDQGAQQTTPRTGTLEAKIPLGDRFSLDFVTLTPSKDCPVSAARLEVTVVPPAATVANDERAEALRAQIIAKRAGGRGRESSPGSGDLNNGAPSSTGDGATAALQLMEARRATRVDQAAPGPLFDAELWLVHKLPDGAERSELIRQPVRDTASFVFPVIHLTSAAGTTGLEVFGFVRRVVGDAGALSLQVAIGQRHVGTASSESYSGSGKTIPWPAATEVLSFELPADSRLPSGHRFDLRVRLRPR